MAMRLEVGSHQVKKWLFLKKKTRAAARDFFTPRVRRAEGVPGMTTED
jgi:hypothetical protein